MNKLLKIAGAVAVSATLALPAFSEELEFRISTENNANHVNTQFLQAFVAAVNEAGEGKIHAELFHSGQLYKGRDVPRALRQGSVDMATVGSWQVGGVAANFNLLFIPHFYGRAGSEINDVVDGPFGAVLNAELGESINSHVLGPWMGFGAGNLFGVGDDPIDSFEDLQGAKIRIPGGAANTARISALGAIPTVLPWPDTPLALQQGTVDGLLTTFESARSAKLWESGVTSAFEDNQYYAFFIPLISNAFWDEAPDDVKAILTDTWAEMIGDGRQAAADAQANAREILIENGVTITALPAEELAAMRAIMVENEPALIEDLGASLGLYEQLKAEMP